MRKSLLLLQLMLKPWQVRFAAPSLQLVAFPKRPLLVDREEWRAYWQTQGQPWRTEPEIDEKRQEYLAGRRNILPNIERGIYPFKDMKLSRADVEWLLITHENGRGPVDWSDEGQQGREGLDVRGADLCQVNLRDLPLARLCGGLAGGQWNTVSDEHLEMAAVRLEGADLRTHLEGVEFSGAHLVVHPLSKEVMNKKISLCQIRVRATFQSPYYWPDAPLRRCRPSCCTSRMGQPL